MDSYQLTVSILEYWDCETFGPIASGYKILWTVYWCHSLFAWIHFMLCFWVMYQLLLLIY